MDVFPDLVIFLSIKSRNLHVHVAHPLVFRALDRSNKKQLRDRFAFLVSSSWPLLSTVYSYTSHTTVLSQVVTYDVYRESPALECLTYGYPFFTNDHYEYPLGTHFPSMWLFQCLQNLLLSSRSAIPSSLRWFSLWYIFPLLIHG